MRLTKGEEDNKQHDNCNGIRLIYIVKSLIHATDLRVWFSLVCEEHNDNQDHHDESLGGQIWPNL